MSYLPLVVFNHFNQTLELLIVEIISDLWSLGELIEPGINVNHCHQGILLDIKLEDQPLHQFDQPNGVLVSIDLIKGRHLLQLGLHQLGTLSPN